MSAFMVSKRHIDVLVRTAYWGPDTQRDVRPDHCWYRPSFKGFSNWQLEQCNEVGEMLIKENLSSIHSRYPDTLENTDATPGPIEQYWLTEYELEDWFGKRLTPIEALKALDCYEYQSCEHPEWEKSEAYDFCQRFRHSLIGNLPGYEDAPWEWMEKQAA